MSPVNSPSPLWVYRPHLSVRLMFPHMSFWSVGDRTRIEKRKWRFKPCGVPMKCKYDWISTTIATIYIYRYVAMSSSQLFEKIRSRYISWRKRWHKLIVVWCTWPVCKSRISFPVCAKSTHQKLLVSLARMQRKAALWITDAFESSPSHGVEAIAGLIPLNLHLKKLAERSYWGGMTHSDYHPIVIVVEVDWHTMTMLLLFYFGPSTRTIYCCYTICIPHSCTLQGDLWATLSFRSNLRIATLPKQCILGSLLSRWGVILKVLHPTHYLWPHYQKPKEEIISPNQGVQVISS